MQNDPALSTAVLKGCHNFRDLGGYLTRDGRKVKTGFFYRSDCLHRIKKSDRRLLIDLGIQKIVDFRGDNEVKKKPDKIPASISYLRLPIDAAGKDREVKVKQYMFGKTQLDLEEYMIDTYQVILRDFSDIYSKWFRQLIDVSRIQLFHCTAGKDRTGLAAAFLLRLLGVSLEDIMQDYLKTNFLSALYNRKITRNISRATCFRVDGTKLLPVLEVKEIYLKTAWNYIDSQWGSWEEFVKRGLKLKDEDIKILKDRYLT